MTWQIWSVVPVWVASLAVAVVIGLTRADSVAWLAIALAGAIIGTFAIQLAIQRKEGFVLRAMASISGAIVVLAVAGGILALVAG